MSELKNYKESCGGVPFIIVFDEFLINMLGLSSEFTNLDEKTILEILKRSDHDYALIRECLLSRVSERG